MSVATAGLPGPPARLPVVEIFDHESGERLVVSRLAAVPGVELIDVRNSRRLWRVFHQSYDLCLVPHESNDPLGVSHWTYRGRMYDTTPGGVILTEPGELHAMKSMERPAVHYWLLQIDPALVVSAAAEMGAATPPHVRIPMTYSTSLFGALSRFHRAVLDDESTLEQQTRFAECVRLIITEACEGSPSSFVPAAPAGVMRARDYLHSHFAEPVRLDDLAAVAGVSRFHLTRAFARTFGLPPHAYQNQLRLAAARSQLQRGVPPARVEVGFADQAHLTRHFKSAWGITPGQYARLIRAFGGPPPSAQWP
jgi:AraC-like DNA-binding protein